MTDTKPERRNSPYRRCKCNCGYRCGGPGVCEVPRCHTIDDGTHYVRECEHVFSGPQVCLGSGFYSTICTYCAMPAIEHDLRHGV